MSLLPASCLRIITVNSPFGLPAAVGDRELLGLRGRLVEDTRPGSVAVHPIAQHLQGSMSGSWVAAVPRWRVEGMRATGQQRQGSSNSTSHMSLTAIVGTEVGTSRALVQHGHHPQVGLQQNVLILPVAQPNSCTAGHEQEPSHASRLVTSC